MCDAPTAVGALVQALAHTQTHAPTHVGAAPTVGKSSLKALNIEDIVKRSPTQN